jgi:hypothetical protein
MTPKEAIVELYRRGHRDRQSIAQMVGAAVRYVSRIINEIEESILVQRHD